MSKKQKIKINKANNARIRVMTQILGMTLNCSNLFFLRNKIITDNFQCFCYYKRNKIICMEICKKKIQTLKLPLQSISFIFHLL